MAERAEAGARAAAVIRLLAAVVAGQAFEGAAGKVATGVVARVWLVVAERADKLEGAGDADGNASVLVEGAVVQIRAELGGFLVMESGRSTICSVRGEGDIDEDELR